MDGESEPVAETGDAPAYAGAEPAAEAPAVELALSGPGPAASAGQYYSFKTADGKKIALQLDQITDSPPDIAPSEALSLTGATSNAGGDGEARIERTKTMEEVKLEEDVEKIETLIPDSTNAWLYMDDKALTGDDASGREESCMESLKNCRDSSVNEFIALLVIVLQISAYILMTVVLVDGSKEEYESRQELCYGANCDAKQKVCMSVGTGGLTSVLLVGFLWADVVNTLSLMVKSTRWLIASLPILVELITAIVCGFLVGLYSDSDFDAIGGAVGILFVHDLDEKVFASMQAFRGSAQGRTRKKIIALALWLIASLTVAFSVACRYEEGSWFGTCLETEFQCTSDATCIWEGLVCNGVEDCSGGEDEFGPGKNECNYAQTIVCPGPSIDDWDPETGSEDERPTHFMCESTGTCITWDRRCNGVIDCPDGSDEGRSQNCQEVIGRVRCNRTLEIVTNDDGYTQTWKGQFKCNNGQCIDAQYACDGTPNDCVDGSDEYPNFDKATERPWLVACPYAKLRTCSDNEILCKLDGACISKTALCDGTADCADGSDELFCDYTCENAALAGTQFQCGGNIAAVTDTELIKWFDITQVADIEADGALDAYTLKRSEIDSDDRDTLFDGETGACIPSSWRCDGIYDCADGTDEQLCGVLPCEEDEYRCEVSGICIPTTWLCDGNDDCINGDDEESQTCRLNGVDPNAGACADGQYSCLLGSSGVQICVDSWGMCDYYEDCPLGDDEQQVVCDSFFATGSSSSGSAGTLSCGKTVSGTVNYYDTVTFATEIDTAGTTHIKISTCDSDHEGSGYLYMFNEPDYNIYVSYSNDNECGCSGRPLILSSKSNDGWALNTEYTVEFYALFTGNYKISLECDTKALSGGSSPKCESSGSNTFSPWGNGGGFGTTSWMYSPMGSTVSGGGSGTTSGGGGQGTTAGGGGGQGTTAGGGGGQGTTAGGGGQGTTAGGGGGGQGTTAGGGGFGTTLR